MYILQTASEPAHIEKAGRLRYKVYVEQEQVMPANRHRAILDAYDRDERTTTLLVWRGDPYQEPQDRPRPLGEPIATLRLTVGPPSRRFPAEEICPIDDLKRALKAQGAVLANVGMLAIDRTERTKGLLGALLCYAYTVGRAQGATHLVAPVASEIRSTMQKLGLSVVRKVRPRHIDNDVFLMVGGRPEIEARILERVPRGFEGYASECRRIIYQRGEKMCVRGDRGQTAWGILSGHARFRFGNKEGHIWPGEIAGEILLLKKLLCDDHPGRTADLEPASRILTTMEIPENLFRKILDATPAPARGLLVALADRLIQADLALDALDEQVHMGEELRNLLLRYGYGLHDLDGDLDLAAAADELGTDPSSLRSLWRQLVAAGAIQRGPEGLKVFPDRLKAFQFTYRLART